MIMQADMVAAQEREYMSDLSFITEEFISNVNNGLVNTSRPSSKFQRFD